MSLQRVQEALEYYARGGLFDDMNPKWAKKALKDLKEYTETPKDKAKDRYHYGYTAAQKEYTERLESQELLSEVAEEISFELGEEPRLAKIAAQAAIKIIKGYDAR